MPSTRRPAARCGGQILIDALSAQEVKHVFCVPGESYLAALDALHDAPGIRTVVCRQEGAAAMMAEASAKLTGRPGVCFVTRGPGASNAASGIHVAAQDSTPVVLLIGQVSRDTLCREAFQEIDYSRFYGPLTKHVEQVHDAARLPEVMSRAFHTACNGRPGPVAVVLPEDVLREAAEVADLPARQRLQLSPDASDMARFAGLLAQAERPLLLAGGRNWDAPSRAALHEFAGRWQLPVAAAWRYQDVFDHTDPQYVGDVGIGINPQLATTVMEADLVIALGIRLGEVTTQHYRRLKVPLPEQQLVHIYPGAEELGRVYYPTLAITALAPAFALALSDIAPPAVLPWAEETRRLHEAYLSWSTPGDAPGEVNLASVISELSDTLDDDAIICNGAGNNTGWLHRFFRFRGNGRQLASTSGSMGYGIPAALAAALEHPDRQVVAVVGDGDIQTTSQELATIVQEELSIVVIVVNNEMLGTIRMHQEMHYPGRTRNSDLHNPDFMALAGAYGFAAERVTQTAEFGPVLRRALAAQGSTLIELVTDAEAIAHTTTLSEIRARSTP
ncbi:MAG: thiamine pyrophosphate-binding protein [Arenicellales bacterium]|jgi:acetolactate synthase-1/2/3 large subunit|nr:thiamine pyrophosphate-binding protein [Arenicellales bacterium]MDP6791699.1 thiamine pyrophosphate-binding protein [Arenicellales bacterium]MDP6918612.1 thiamine pyrophosphate-binding protein [Arenicellales bacterium]|tara:strand:- start:12278 stop:13957 length:1680 start_codon:yes stop_codon:yes gene_type:complete